MTTAQKAREARLRLERAYEGVAGAFQTMAKKVSASFEPEGSSEAFRVTIESSTNPVRLKATCLTKIERLPFRCYEKTATPAQRITVVLDAHEDFDVDCSRAAPSLCLRRSTVRLAYYTLRSAGLCYKLCVRYDFHGAEQAHPIFHAQLDQSGISAAKLVRLRLAPPAPATQQVFQQVRIPTANVIGPTALLQLAADHLPKDSFREVLRKVRGHPVFTQWSCNRSSLDQPRALDSLISSSWYGTH